MLSILAAFAMLALAACGSAGASPAKTKPIHITVAVVPITDAAPFILAVQRGYFARAGLDVTYTITPQSTAAAAARAFARAVEQGQALAASDRAAVEKVLPAYMPITKSIAALVNLNTFPTGVSLVQLQRVADLMQAGGMLKAPLNVAPLVLR